MNDSVHNAITGRAKSVWSVIQTGLTLCSVTILFAMMFLTSFDVVARYVFNSPVRGAFELTEIGLAMVVYLALPVATASGAHIAVELMPQPTSRTLRRILDFAVKLVIATAFALIAWQVWRHAQKILSYDQVSNSLEIPLAYIAMVVAIGAGLSVIACFFHKTD